MAEYTILVTDQNLSVVGDPINIWSSLDLTLKFNEPGSGLFTAPAHSWIRDQFAPGRRVVVVRGPIPEFGYAGELLASGPVEKTMYERADNGENAGVGTFTVNFTDDLGSVVARLTYPNPDKTPETQTQDSWTYTGNAEVALRTLVDLNAGPGALVARRVPNLALGALAGVGSSVTVKTERMQPLGDVLRAVAEAGGGLGFRTRQVGSQILFEVYAPPDVSGTVRFGFNYGNLKYIGTETSAPTATAVVVGGQGDGADRYVLERVNTAEQASWGRIEKLVSRPGGSPTQDLMDAGDQALAEGASTVRVPSNVADTADQRFGIHYGLGSKVAIETAPGQQLVDVVQTVHLQAWPTAGEVVSATIGSQAAKNDPAWVQRLRAIEDRLGTVERIAKPSTP